MTGGPEAGSLRATSWWWSNVQRASRSYRVVGVCCEGSVFAMFFLSFEGILAIQHIVKNIDVLTLNLGASSRRSLHIRSLAARDRPPAGLGWKGPTTALPRPFESPMKT